MREKKIKDEMLGLLRSKLSSDLTYHGVHHTLDVHEVCETYISYYQISDTEAELLRVASIGHDIGFTETYSDHEQVGAGITADLMNKYGYDEASIDVVRKLILATKIPQSPDSFLAKIICDADLDYLGRDDFKSIGNTLKQEWSLYGIVPDLDEHFDNIQIGFLKKHFYHTDFANEYRSPKKLENLAFLEAEQKKKVRVTIN